MEAARLIIEVVAGLMPNTPMPEYTRQWTWSSSDQEAYNAGEKAAQEKYIRIAGESREYAASLENPRKLNWVRRDWIWI